MSHAKFKKLVSRYGGPRTQCAALCWRERRGRAEVLLVTSRRTGRWVLPKGWPLDGEAPPETAEREAAEEAGVSGKVRPDCLGLFTYVKHPDLPDALPCAVAVYPLKVKSLAKSWPEKGQRRRRWFGLKKASAEVEEKELSRLLRSFDPSHLGRGPRARH